MVKPSARVTTQPQTVLPRALRSAGARMESERVRTTTPVLTLPTGLPVTTAVVFPVSNQLSTLAWEFDQEAAVTAAAGGSWSEVLAWGHRRAAAQLRTVVAMLHQDPSVASVRVAQDWRDAAQGHLDAIRGGHR